MKLKIWEVEKDDYKKGRYLIQETSHTIEINEETEKEDILIQLNKIDLLKCNLKDLYTEIIDNGDTKSIYYYGEFILILGDA